MITEPTTTESGPAPTFVRHRDEGRATWMLNGLVVTKATVAETGGAYGLMEHLLTPASNPPLHVQTDEEEGFYLLDGEIEFEVDGTLVHARPGTFAFVPRGATHRFRVLTETARVLVLASAPGGAPAGGLEEFFEAVGEPASAPVLPVPAPPDLDAVAAAAALGGIALLGPPAAS
ncbi:MAG: cupin domain-containing protein [Acidimicrobiales bacterium]